MPGTTNPLGKRTIELFKAGTASREQLDTAYTKGWISDDDYNDAIAPPEPAQATGGAAQATVKKAAAKKS